MRTVLFSLLVLSLTGCLSVPQDGHHVDQVDLQRFMGDWFVLAHIPLPPEKEAWNAVESYRLDDKGRVQTTFRFRKGGQEGPLKTYTPVAYVTDHPSNAIWRMQFFWPFKADFRVVWLNPDYSVTIIGRHKRDYAWIMAREPHISDAQMDQLVAFLESAGYPVESLRAVPQEWSGTPGY